MIDVIIDTIFVINSGAKTRQIICLWHYKLLIGFEVSVLN